jgi:NAD(P)-dependent dehydrogenase (short-subunit alcohol dehydrogenase family)
MDLELVGRVAWVTGGSGGIGSAIAAELAREGCTVALTGRDAPRLASVAARISQETGVTVLGVPADTGRSADVDSAAARINAELGAIEILINGAGAPGGQANGPLEQLSEELLIDDLNVKYVGYLRCARAAVPSMRDRGFGRLIHIGGLSARQSGTYSAGGRNIAIVHASKTLSDELGPFGITSNVVHPSMTVTPWLDQRITADAERRGVNRAEVERDFSQTNAIRRIVDATEIAHVVAFLASPKAGSITGETIAAGGGAQRGVTL